VRVATSRGFDFFGADYLPFASDRPFGEPSYSHHRHARA
jgi:hypothetical protein